MDQVPHSNNDLKSGSPKLPELEHRLPELSWARLLRTGVSGRIMIGLLFATLLTFFAVAFLLRHP